MTQPLPPHTRPARLDDVPALLELCRQLGYPTNTRSMTDRVDRLLARPLVHRVLVAPTPLDDGRLLGAIHGTRRETIESDDYVEVAGLIVDQQARGEGVGKVLVKGVERWARDLGLCAVRLRSNVVRSDAHVFYQRLGYQLLKQQVSFHKEL